MRSSQPVTIPAAGILFTGEPSTTATELLGLIRRPAWHADAACREFPELDWFDGRQADACAAVCGACLVADECAAAGRGESAGMWAGVDHAAAERRRAERADAGRARRETAERRATLVSLVRSAAPLEALRALVGAATLIEGVRAERGDRPTPANLAELVRWFLAGGVLGDEIARVLTDEGRVPAPHGARWSASDVLELAAELGPVASIAEVVRLAVDGGASTTDVARMLNRARVTPPAARSCWRRADVVGLAESGPGSEAGAAA